MNKQLARIEEARLEIRERDILSFWIFVEYESGGCQGIGGLVLDDYDSQKKRRVGTAYGCEMIRQLLLLMKVNDFYQMVGRDIWVLGEGSGLSFEPKGIQVFKFDGGDQLLFDCVYRDMVGDDNE